MEKGLETARHRSSGRGSLDSPKVALRRSLLAARNASDPALRSADDARLAERLVGWVASRIETEAEAGTEADAETGASSDSPADAVADAVAGNARARRPVTIAAHVPVDVEPGATSLTPDAFLSALARIDGMPPIRLLLPVCPPGPPAALQWAEYAAGSLAPGKYGLPEPTGTRLAPEAIAEAEIIVVPGVAADRSGMRMGRGAGYYDRSLAHATGLVAAILHPGELVDDVPRDAHDLPVDAVITADEVAETGPSTPGSAPAENSMEPNFRRARPMK
ncbi:5-formyltetrahydrofolate cyclo-ligase [Corynebacterium xerosis]|uniref:5-formyltetrahydrofolate cyclo-ligase n=1 Tax=Corynebacterium xerosis TaxID=1725 RepID=A0A2N6T201_9CORY|nr:5-formyltetrahydrofolate cyclo-ligase [Corynebacterium xerosis]PMC63351.1 5-formyltetrahydrofolate cyclo-ligase [Corynebacterium xerosis]